MSFSADFVDFYRKLIQQNTISGLADEENQPNKELLDLIQQQLIELGFAVKLHRSQNDKPTKYNLMAKYGEGDGGLMFSGHTDTVPYDVDKWSYPAFDLTLNSGKFYGLGSVDMKVFFAIVIASLKRIDLSKLTKPLYLLASFDEETNMFGVKEFLQYNQELEEKSYKPKLCIVGEPTMLAPVFAHKGHIGKRLNIVGKTGHSSAPPDGVNAIEIVGEVITALKNLAEYLKSIKYQGFSLDYPTLNLGAIKGGDAVNRICADLYLDFDIRPTPNLSITDANILLDNFLTELKFKYPNRIFLRDLHPPIEAFSCDPNSDFIAFIEQASGKKAELVNYCTEAGFLQQLCPTVVLGAGSIEQAHQPDEFIECNQITQAIDLYVKIINKICG